MEKEYDVLRHEEQADEEYSYNWAIDMNWKMFVTVMGICMSGYEKKIPLITSRFFSLYTEYFLIPLRETWVNPKENMVFQFIMGEFYTGDAEFWADMCMEASFISAGQTDYRPPRSLLVNCASEHNYFLNGDFTKKIKVKSKV
ncbi:unnamed protein product [Orchesella dallaii]|uniref:Uncharacterized protein n=1 Tax=Orchesella dallaii TaxID=48710 RepID=A0ABP1PNS6_9HEXA